MTRPGSPLARALTIAIGLGSAVTDTSLAATHDPVPVVDMHVDLPFQVNYRGKKAERASGQFVASKLATAGVVGLLLPLYVPNEVSPSGPRMSDIESSYSRMLGVVQRTLPYLPPGSPPAPGRVVTWFSFEGAAPFAGHPEAVLKWVAHGVRVWGLVHVHDNALATSAGSGRKRRKTSVGLTEAGHELVRAIHHAHAIVDVSHASDRAIADILEQARQDRVPVVATHSNAYRLARHARNLTDDQLRGIAATGGVIGVNFHGKFLAIDRRATIEDVVEQIRYMADLVGIRHVGIGSDFEGEIQPPAGLNDVSGYQNLARALRRAGFSDKDVETVFSGNVLRLLGAEPSSAP